MAKWLAILVGWILFSTVPALAQERSEQERSETVVTRTCGAGITVTLAEDSSRKFNLARACELYADLIQHHIPNAVERPGAVFYLTRNLEICEQADLTSSLGSPPVLVSCLRRSRTATEIWLVEDKPEHYIISMIDGLDYANRLYLPRSFLQREASEAVAELTRPELRGWFHGTVSVKEIR